MDTPGAIGGVRSAREMKKSPRKQDKKNVADGNVAKIMRKVKPAEHAADVLAALA